MTHQFDIIENEHNIKTAQSNWDSPLDFSRRSNTYKLFRALLSRLEEIDEDLESIYAAHHIQSAHDDNLEKIGRLLNVQRQSEEPDDKYRSRILATFRASTTGTTWDEFVEFSAAVLATNIESIDFSTNYVSEPATVRVSTQPSVLENINITGDEASNFLSRGVPAGHNVILLEGGTFRLKADGDTDDADKGLTSDAIETGGTLSEDA